MRFIPQKEHFLEVEFFLHNQGYNFFNSGALTIAEINYLIEGYNQDQKKKASALKKAQRKAKRRR